MGASLSTARSTPRCTGVPHPDGRSCRACSVSRARQLQRAGPGSRPGGSFRVQLELKVDLLGNFIGLCGSRNTRSTSRYTGVQVRSYTSANAASSPGSASSSRPISRDCGSRRTDGTHNAPTLLAELIMSPPVADGRPPGWVRDRDLLTVAPSAACRKTLAGDASSHRPRLGVRRDKCPHFVRGPAVLPAPYSAEGGGQVWVRSARGMGRSGSAPVSTTSVAKSRSLVFRFWLAWRSRVNAAVRVIL